MLIDYRKKMLAIDPEIAKEFATSLAVEDMERTKPLDRMERQRILQKPSFT
jgi:hypothetical protein